MINRNQIRRGISTSICSSTSRIYSGLTGMNLLVIKQSDAAIIADLMLGGDGIRSKTRTE